MGSTSSVPSWKWRFYLTIVLLTLWMIFQWVYAGLQGPIEGAASVSQLKDSAVGYSFGRAIGGGLIQGLVAFLLTFITGVIWITYIVGVIRDKNGSNSAMIALISFLALGGATNCGPMKVETFVGIQPNETAFVIPLEGASNDGQAKFDSVAFLEAKKVATKRISLSQRLRDTGRMWWDYEWIPTVMVIKVDRSPVTREWTKSTGTGTAETDQSFHMQSLDSIPIHIGATLTVSVEENDTATFLYHYRGDNLAHVCDTNIRSFMLGELSGMFAQVNLATGMQEKKGYFDKAFADAGTYFKKQGITVNYFGISGGLGYDNIAVQDSLDKKFIAENDKQVAQNEQNAQTIRNATAVAKALADAEAAAKFAAAKDALTVKTEMEAVLLRAQAMVEASKKWDGKLPSGIVPQGATLLFGLGDTVATTPR